MSETPQEKRLWLFGVLIGPNAVISHSVVGGTLSLLLRREGVGLTASASIVSLLWVPFIINFLLGPITDFWLRRKQWIMAASVAAALLMVAAFHMPSLGSPIAITLLFLSACFGQLVLASCGGMLGTLRSEDARRRAGSFYQGGSLAIGSIGVFVISMLVDRMSVPALSWVIAFMIVLPSLAALAVPFEQQVCTEDSFREKLGGIGREFRATFLQWRTIPYTLLLCSPMGSGAAIGLFGGLAKDYGVTAHQVGWMNGFASLALTPLGAVIAGHLPLRLRSVTGYLAACAISAATMIVLWLGPMRPWTYFVSTALFLFTIGACYAMYTAVTLEFLGDSGRSGSARFSLINSFGNVPVSYMNYVDGQGYRLWGPRGLPGTETVLGLAASALWAAYFLLRRNKPA